MDVAQLALALGSSFTAGLNLYLTVLSLGVMDRLQWLELPEGMAVLSHPLVMLTAGALFLIEFVADKVPYVDNLWDSIHTFIRVPAGALLAASAFSNVAPEHLWAAALVGGFVTFTSHGAKASTRLAVNSTPEPVSNWFLSFFEDGVSLFLIWLAATYPYLAILVAVLLVVAGGTILFFFFQFFRRLFRRRPEPQAV